MYIRIKPVKTQEYAYLIENKWNKRKKAIKKKNKAYLGRIYRLQKTKSEDISQEVFKNSYKNIIKILISQELKNHNFKQKQDILYLDNLTINLKSLIVQKNNKPVTLLINEGFLNNYTLKKTINYKIKTDYQLIEGKKLAKLLVLTGLKLKPEQFILLFQKLYKTKKE